MSGAHALASAVFARLQAELAVPVYDAPPVGARYPYVVIGPMRSVAWSADDLAGEDQAVSVHIWSRYAGAKELRELMGAVRAAVDAAPLAVAGHRVVLLDFLSAEDARESDGVTRHGIVRFRALTEPEG